MGVEPEVGSIMEGKVTAIMKFGAFVALEGGRSGLVHISEIANSYVNDVHDYLQEGQSVKVRVLTSENGKLNLSIKKALPQEEGRSFAPRGVGGLRPFVGGGSRPVGGSGPRPAGGGYAPATRSGPARAQAIPPSGDVDFEDKLKKFLSASEGKMADLNRSVDGKRGGKRRK
ncbi:MULTISPECIES: S1 RNA-binding domain-containing protein [unclassified Oscillibacter]|uniref:S1 RNA-binding domain-containing protein n=1 Tax=unclassified Oscillibacter TaxID=2629304 RepID=UPI0025DD88B5|nr:MULTISPECIES: S1 RNA-binding domain-containing protein [unclassified Oscillibacter]